jgi:pimeloyl-ACP methyl ester carboxylesterase
MHRNLGSITSLLSTSALVMIGASARGACLDNVVLVHGNAGYPSDWDATVSALKGHGYLDAQIYRPNWGSKFDPAGNDHGVADVKPVKTALIAALVRSCTGKIDVVGHSMGVTLAMKAINELQYAERIRSFVGIAGAQHGLHSCGVYPNSFPTATCGVDGLSIDSPLVKSIRGKRYGARMYSIKSFTDEIVCIGGCKVNGSHTSNIDLQDSSVTYKLGHYALQSKTADKQVELIMK